MALTFLDQKKRNDEAARLESMCDSFNSGFMQLNSTFIEVRNTVYDMTLSIRKSEQLYTVEDRDALKAKFDAMLQMFFTAFGQVISLNENGELINQNGHLVNKQGKLINENLELVDEAGNLVNEEGHLIDDQGRLINADGHLVDDQERLINEGGFLVDDQERLINEQGQLINADGSLVEGNSAPEAPEA